jgi:hypothetical protein
MAFASLLHWTGQLSYLQHCSLQGAFPTKRTMATDESFKNCPALANLYCCNVFKSPCAVCEFPSPPVAGESNSYFYCTRSIPRWHVEYTPLKLRIQRLYGPRAKEARKGTASLFRHRSLHSRDVKFRTVTFGGEGGSGGGESRKNFLSLKQ